MALRTARPTKRRRSSHHQFRKRVPADVLAVANGQCVTFRLPTGQGDSAPIVVTVRREISFSLRTPIAMLAKQRHAAIVLQFERWCSAVRAGQPAQADDVSAPPPDERTPLNFEALWIRWEREAKPAPSTVSTWWGYVAQFQRHLGHNDPRRVKARRCGRMEGRLIGSWAHKRAGWASSRRSRRYSTTAFVTGC